MAHAGRPRIAPKEKRDQDSYRLPRWMHEWLVNDADEQGIAKAKLIEQIVTRYVQRKMSRSTKEAQAAD